MYFTSYAVGMLSDNIISIYFARFYLQCTPADCSVVCLQSPVAWQGTLGVVFFVMTQYYVCCCWHVKLLLWNETALHCSLNYWSSCWALKSNKFFFCLLKRDLVNKQCFVILEMLEQELLSGLGTFKGLKGL